MLTTPGRGPQAEDAGQETPVPGSACWRLLLLDQGFEWTRNTQQVSESGEPNPSFLPPSPEILVQLRVNFSALFRTWRKQRPHAVPCVPSFSPTGQYLSNALDTYCRLHQPPPPRSVPFPQELSSEISGGNTPCTHVFYQCFLRCFVSLYTVLFKKESKPLKDMHAPSCFLQHVSNYGQRKYTHISIFF